MTVIETLTSLSFQVTDLGTKDGKTLVRVKTSNKGWAYERLATEADTRAWVLGKTP